MICDTLVDEVSSTGVFRIRSCTPVSEVSPTGVFGVPAPGLME
ncbi:hypothetical protein SAMN06296065_11072 [Novosphingobium panipatense]|uniref:Uncharacterized protein n=1 Tax=Novosphingobium panipatense TaxID=428991 RepID=A0ABY1QT01_9SPHN|nr:hypothetical protein SAMN06296065_11072 [Novosphingobium panipatense]